MYRLENTLSAEGILQATLRLYNFNEFSESLILAQNERWRRG